ncbi:hypothetical protein GCM10009665_48430 [Kitasatospora nipponensis]|uniref:Uncharacterized protein n=1 Tax=Kitasatospora nipponensis TaxID=258049 RepID=A0ABN1WMX9_9ACTN
MPTAPPATSSFEEFDFESETHRLCRLAAAFHAPAADAFVQGPGALQNAG